MHSFVPPRSAAADRKSPGRPRRRLVGARVAPPPLRLSPAVDAPRNAPTPRISIAPRDSNRLPEGLQTVMEAMSGFSLADVVVHRNSAEPARLGAAAFTKGDQIHLAPGQERHLPHEAWHVVQQAQGRVRPTTQMKSDMPVNDDAGLELEADAMGQAAMALPQGQCATGHDAAPHPSAPASFLAPRQPILQTATRAVHVTQLFRMTGNAPSSLHKDPKGDSTVTATLPKNSRFKVKAADLLGLHGDNKGPNQWIQIEVITGPQLGALGWLQAKDVESADQPDTQKIDPLVAQGLFNELAKARFTASDGTEYDVPFSYPMDGCYARAHRMAELLSDKGYASEKSFAVAGKGVNHPLRVKSSKSADVPQGNAPEVTWGYHVAPVITYADNSKNVIDPSIFDKPVPLATWVGSMGNINDFKLRQLSEIEQAVKNKTLTPEYRYYLTPKSQYFPTEDGGGDKGMEGDVQWKGTGPKALGRDVLAKYARDYEPAHILAGELRAAIAKGGGAPECYALLRKASNSTCLRFFILFPNLAKIPAQQLEKEIRAIIAGNGTASDKYTKLGTLLRNAVPGTMIFMNVYLPQVIADMNAAVGGVYAAMLKAYDWK
ncbi:MAG: hypothetical protein JWP15_2760 [Alphaproteobacteria bacterium]|nr:hypothetical protein [Alphaproteobacteria bacterium]